MEQPASGSMVQMGVRNENPVYMHHRAELLNDVQPAPRIEKDVHGIHDQEGVGKRRPAPVIAMDYMEGVRDAGDADALFSEFVKNHGAGLYTRFAWMVKRVSNKCKMIKK